MLSTDRVAAMIAELGTLNPENTDTERIDLLTALEHLKSATSAAQARLTDAFAVSQRAILIGNGAETRDARRSVGAQVALARRDSPHKGNRHVGLAATLVHEMPGVLGALQRGQTSEWRATLIARETAHLSREHRAEIDAAIAGQLGGWGDRRTEREARAWAQRLDPCGAADRARKAAGDRRVSIRPAPDCMTYLTALLPVKEGVAVYGELHRRAMSAAVDPDEHRSKGQVMADTVLDRRPRKLGTTTIRRVLTPNEGEPARPGVEVHLVMTDRTLTDGDPEPAHLIGYGPVPAPVARNLVTADQQTRVWVRRLYTDPATGDLAATDARRRDFPMVARMFLTCRDQTCRTPFCGAPIRHTDHALAVSKGGVTDLRNGNGRCASCNLTKDLPGWATHLTDGTITTTTPTGHQHVSRPPRPPQSKPWIPALTIDLQWPGTG